MKSNSLKSFAALLETESIKMIKSKLPYVLTAAFSLAPIMGAIFAVVLSDKELLEANSALAAKAQMTGFGANWEGYLGLLSHAVGVGGLIVFGFLSAWCFGREFAEGTAKELMTLPLPRVMIVLAKLLVIISASILMTIFIVVLGIVISILLGLPGFSASILLSALAKTFTVTLLVSLLSFPAAFAACAGRGYLVPLGFIILMVVLGQIVGALGYGAYFPWALPAIYSGLIGNGSISPAAFAVFFATGALGFVALLFQWSRAEQSG